jgi:hypothetical protein
VAADYHDRLPRRSDETFLVARTDDNGVVFLVQDGLDASHAAALCSRVAAIGHKQHFSVHPYRSEERRLVLRQIGIRE